MNLRAAGQFLTILAVMMHLAVLIKPLWIDAVQGGSSVQICSGADVITIYMDENGERKPAPPEMRIHDCAMCLGASMAAMDGDTKSVIIAQAVIDRAPLPLKNTAPRTSAARETHQSRAPPAYS